LVTAIFLPFSSATELIVEFLPTTRAVHSGLLYTSMILIGVPLARATKAAEPAVDPKSHRALLGVGPFVALVVWN